MPDLNPSGELDLINRARSGSVEAFEQLVFKYQDRLYRLLLARSANRADAEDALQETFVAAYKYLASYRTAYAFSTWLFTIALRELAKVANKGRLEKTEVPENVRSQGPGPEQVGIGVQRRESLWSTAKNCLGETQFTALWLFYVEDMPIKDIAKAMRRPVSWVKVNLMRARRRLMVELQRQPSTYAAPAGEVTL